MITTSTLFCPVILPNFLQASRLSTFGDMVFSERRFWFLAKKSQK